MDKVGLLALFFCLVLVDGTSINSKAEKQPADMRDAFWNSVHEIITGDKEVVKLQRRDVDEADDGADEPVNSGAVTLPILSKRQAPRKSRAIHRLESYLRFKQNDSMKHEFLMSITVRYSICH